MMFLKIFNFLTSIGKFFSENSDNAATSGSCYLQTQFDLHDLTTAMGMAKWASQGVNFPDCCNRAKIFGFFLAAYYDEAEAITALKHFIDEISPRVSANWARRDIIEYAQTSFWKPDLDGFIDCYLGEKYEVDDELYAQIKLYDESPEMAKAQMYACPDADTEVLDQLIKDLEHFYHRVQFYAEHEEYLKRMDEEVDKFIWGEPTKTSTG